jgi:hypothetical protein
MADIIAPGIPGNSVAPVTANTQGAMPAPDKAKLDTLAAGGWLDLQARRIAATVVDGSGNSLLNGLRSIALPAVATGIADYPIAGGARSCTRGATGAPSYDWAYISDVLLVDPGSHAWALAIRARLTGVGSFTFMGLVGDGSSTGNGVQIEHFGTNYLNIYLNNTGQTTAVSTATVSGSGFRDHILSFDGTTVRLSVDGTLVGFTTTLTNMPTGNMRIGVNALNEAAIITDIAFAYVRP